MQLAVTGESFWELGTWLEAEGLSWARPEGQTPSSGLLETQPCGLQLFASPGPPQLSSRRAGPCLMTLSILRASVPWAPAARFQNE